VIKTKPWGAFLYRDYRFLWASLIAGSVVVWMRILGTAQWLLDETGSAYYVGLIGVVQLVVQVPVTLWAGNLADRMDRKRLMTFSTGATSVVLLTLGALNGYGLLTPTMVYIGIAITAGTHMLASPARSALVPIIIPNKDLMLAASTDTASANAAAITGPLMFAFVAVTLGLTEVFLLAGLIALAASLIPLFVRAPGMADGHENDEKPSQIQQT
jgi:MFS family permease